MNKTNERTVLSDADVVNVQYMTGASRPQVIAIERAVLAKLGAVAGNETVQRLHEIAYRDSAVAVTVRTEDLRAILARLLPAASEAEFKNFHRALCERFDYCHDERDWKRDQVSLIEHIAKKVAASEAGAVPFAYVRTLDLDRLRNYVVGAISKLPRDGFTAIHLTPPAPVEAGAVPVRLYDSQWVNIVNHANCWADYSKEDAVHEAVKMTEQAIKANAKAALPAPVEAGAQESLKKLAMKAYPHLTRAEINAAQPATVAQCVACEGKPSGDNVPCAVCGAPAAQGDERADLQIGVAVAVKEGVTVCILQRHEDRSTTVIYSKTHPFGDSVGHAALARQQGGGDAEDGIALMPAMPDADALIAMAGWREVDLGDTPHDEFRSGARMMMAIYASLHRYLHGDAARAQRAGKGDDK